jgi:nucleotide-binding universal stress UspA family protein
MKSILAIADGGPALDMTIAAGGLIAGLFQARLDVLHVRDPLALGGAMAVAAMAEAPGQIVFEENRAKEGLRAGLAKQAFTALSAGLGDAHFSDVEGSEDVVVPARGRLADLIVIGRPGADEMKPEPHHARAAIFDCARPVLIVAPGWKPTGLGHAVVAWNGSAQSARALGYALPLLHRFGKVTVLSAGSKDGRAPTDVVLRYLALHGLKAAAVEIDGGSGSARARGRTLLQHVEKLGADLLVMGAYGQPAVMRFLGLGGATAKVITACKVPVFLAH